MHRGWYEEKDQEKVYIPYRQVNENLLTPALEFILKSQRMPPPINNRIELTIITIGHITSPAIAIPLPFPEVIIAMMLSIKPMIATGITPQFIQPRNGRKPKNIPMTARILKISAAACNNTPLIREVITKSKSVSIAA